MRINLKEIHAYTGDLQDRYSEPNRRALHGSLTLTIHGETDSEKLMGRYPIKAQQELDVRRLPKGLKERVKDVMQDIEDHLNQNPEGTQMTMDFPERPPSPPPDSKTIPVIDPSKFKSGQARHRGKALKAYGDHNISRPRKVDEQW